MLYGHCFRKEYGDIHVFLVAHFSPRFLGTVVTKAKWLRISGAIQSCGVALCPLSVLAAEDWKSSYLGRLSLRSLPLLKSILHRWENGPGGSRTRICDLDRVPCFRYTTGPDAKSLRIRRRTQGHKSQFHSRVPERETIVPYNGTACTKKPRSCERGFVLADHWPLTTGH